MMKKLLLPLWIFAAASSLIAAPSEVGESKKKDAMSTTKKVVIGAAGVAGTAAVIYLIYRFNKSGKSQTIQPKITQIRPNVDVVEDADLDGQPDEEDSSGD